MIQQFKMDKHDAEVRRKAAERVYMRSYMRFLMSHNGHRPKKIELAVGVPGGGKSTLRNTLIYDFIENNPSKRIFLWLSEESLDDFKADISKNPYLLDKMSNVLIYSEQDNLSDFENRQESLEMFSSYLIKSEADFFIYDNITTSRLYGSKFQDNEEFCNILKRSIVNADTAAFVFAHTGSHIKPGHNGIIDVNDIRGSKTLSNLAEFAYVMQTFKRENEVYTTITIRKHRGFDVDHKIYAFNYCPKLGIYDRDVSLPWKDFQRMHQKQNKLR